MKITCPAEYKAKQHRNGFPRKQSMYVKELRREFLRTLEYEVPGRAKPVLPATALRHAFYLE